MGPSAPGFTFSTVVEVCLRDLDGLGHVNNAVYSTYLETTRNRWVFARTGKTKVTDFDFILASTTIRFRSPASLHDRLLVSLRPARIGRSSWDLTYEIRDAASGRLVVEAESVQVMFDYQAGHPVPVPDAFRRLLEAEMRPTGAPTPVTEVTHEP